MATITNRPEQADSTIPELLKQLSEQTQTLVRQELDLAKAEMTQKGKAGAKGAGMFGGAGLFGFFAFAALTACFIALIATAVNHVWLAALIVAVVYGAIAGVLAMRGKTEIKQATPPKPEQTVDTVKEDVEWAKTRARSAGT
jgi:Flp pilus assembly protein TadB